MWIEKYILNLKSLFPKCCTTFSDTVSSKLHNSLYVSIFFSLSENPTYSEFKRLYIKGEEKTHKVSHPIRIRYCVPWKKKIFNSALKKSDLLFNYFPVSNLGSSDSRDGRQKIKKKKRKRNRDSYSIFYLNFLKEQWVQEK